MGSYLSYFFVAFTDLFSGSAMKYILNIIPSAEQYLNQVIKAIFSLEKLRANVKWGRRGGSIALRRGLCKIGGNLEAAKWRAGLEASKSIKLIFPFTLTLPLFPSSICFYLPMSLLIPL